MPSLTITWNVSSDFKDIRIKEVLESIKGEELEAKTEYEKYRWKASGLSLVRYEKKLFCQGPIIDDGLELVKKISEIEGLSLDRNNKGKFLKLVSSTQNAIICRDCYKDSLLIEGIVTELDISFKTECGHEDDMRPPLQMLTWRVLPDLNILIGNNLSKYIEMGYFNGFEIVIPDFTHKVLDLLGRNEKKGALRELEKLKEQSENRKIEIFYYKDGKRLPKSREEFEDKDDETFLEIANLTNSILLTGDGAFKQRAISDNRPTIFIHPQESKKMKKIERVRKL